MADESVEGKRRHEDHTAYMRGWLCTLVREGTGIERPNTRTCGSLSFTKWDGTRKVNFK